MTASLFSYDKPRLLQALAAMSPPARLACATAAATRLMPVCERFAAVQATGKQDRAREIVAELWQCILADDAGQQPWTAVLDEVMAMIPGKEVEGGLLTMMAEDALASLAYAVRCLLVDTPQEAEWAVGREYDATDQAAIKLMGVVPNTPKKEARLLAHPLIQRTLGRQHEDLVLLRRGDFAELLRQAVANPTFSEQELTGYASVK
ncbi:hypothetical protein SRABI118_03646 [Massilia sp. Bi118]|uniref:DUF416 family protein n=1 Tax=Massilia sp. Bi118 TaxID=2822346 RepID=UPI001D5F7C2D|nr:DUF416 family protein [Massilia sp. Bi118]CAH0276536.1 hypothetical protein SRABI118_03646 [Massilia sp. Bi118]